MDKSKQIDEARRRLRDWWDDPRALGRPVVLCNCDVDGRTPSVHWEYFRYPRMLIELLGNDDLKPRLKAAQQAPYKDIPPLPKAPTGWTLDPRNPDHRKILDQVEQQVAAAVASNPFADAIPILRSQAGPGFPGCCLGEYSCLPTTGPGTIWYETVRRRKELERLELDTTSPWWLFTFEVTRQHLEKAPDWVEVGFPSQQGTLDMLQTLRGTRNMVRDMHADKAWVKRVLDQLLVASVETTNRFWDEINKTRNGSGSFIGIWAPGKAPSIQCDALAYLGPKQFKEFALPYIIAELENTEFGTFHLDGPGALKFVHDLLEIPDLDLVQWVEGYGNPDGVALDWYPLVRKVLEAGKRILLYTTPDRVPHLMRRLQRDGVDPRGVCFDLGKVQLFEVGQFLPWLDMGPVENADESGESGGAGHQDVGVVEGTREWYPEGFWDEYQEILEEEPERYRDLERATRTIQLHYE